MTAGDDDKIKVDALLNRADDLISQNKNGEAIKLLQEAIESCKVTDEYLEITRVLDLLGRMLLEAGELKLAQQNYCRSLIIKQRELGVVNRELAVAYRNVAACTTDDNERKGYIDQAETMELPEAEFQMLKQSLLTDDELAKLTHQKE